MRRLVSVVFMAALLATLLSGCLFRGAEALYTLPRLSEDYTNLQDEIEALIDSGLEYATPKTGDNTQAIQFHDLDGDGQSEVLAFFRDEGTGDGTMLYICIYQKTDDGLYEAVAELSGEGSAIHSVEYVELDNDGIIELVVNYQISDRVYSLSVYTLAEYNPSLLMQSGCSAYAVTDLDDDSIHEILLLQLDSSESGNRAEWYTLSGDALVLTDSALLSDELVALTRTRTGRLADGEAAVYVTAAYGSSGEQLITDVIALQDNALTNLTRDEESGISTATLRVNPGDSIFATDINGDGIYEIPIATELTDLGATGIWQVSWLQFRLDGSYEQVCTTLHAPEEGDGWYLELPGSFWTRFSGKLGVTRTQSYANEEVTITLYDCSSAEEGTEGTALLEIYVIGGANRTSRSQLTGRYTLYTGSDTVYAFGLESASGLTQAQVSESFHFVPTTWS